MESWHTLGGRLRWAIKRQPHQGRQRGLRLFQRRMEEHGLRVPGTSLSAIQGYLRDDPAEPSPSFLLLAARLLSVRVGWLAFGGGAPTEEEERTRGETPEAELFRISTTVYEALGVSTKVPPGTLTIQHPEGLESEGERFWGHATWAPLVRQTALRLYQYRPSWALLSEGSEDGGERAFEEARVEDPEPRFWLAVEDTAQAIAAPLKAVGVDASQLTLEDVADYVSAVALTLQRTMWRYAPGAPDEVKESPLMAALLKPYIDEPVPEEED